MTPFSPVATQSRLEEEQGGGDYFRPVKIKINSVEKNFPPGTKFIELVNQVRESNRDNPVLKSLIEKTGKDHITFAYNRRVVKPSEYDSIELKEGDEIRWMLPYAGG
jgi:sulfur carrier protein ThiS